VPNRAIVVAGMLRGLLGVVGAASILAGCSGSGQTAQRSFRGRQTAELSIHFRQLDDGRGLTALSANGLRICKSDDDIERIHVTIESVPANFNEPSEYTWTCEQLRED